jgi:hypothetical protein
LPAPGRTVFFAYSLSEIDSMRLSTVPVLLALLLIAACQGTPSKGPAAGDNPQTQGSTSPAEPNAVVLQYDKPASALAKYRGFLVDPPSIATDDDAFDDISDDDKHRLADKLGQEFKMALAPRFGLASAPAIGIVRLHLTLEGVKTSNSVLSTGMRLLPIGMAMSVVRGSMDKPAHFTGFVVISGKLSDSASGAPLAHFSAKVSPRAYNLTSGLGSQRAAELGIERGASEFAEAVAQNGQTPARDTAQRNGAPSK